MEFLNSLLNIIAPIVTISSFMFLLPPYLFLNFYLSIFRSIFNTENVAGKVVVITGASSGIGEHLAYEYAKRGAYLLLAARRSSLLHEVAEKSALLGSPCVIPLVSDVSKMEDCKRLIEEAITNFGQLDHLVNNASVTPLTTFEDVSDFRNLEPSMEINFWGSVYTTYFAIPYLRKTGGRIIVIASSASWLNAPRLSFYNASKAAVVSFFETLRVEIGSRIGITIVTPGLVESEVTKGKFLTKEGTMEVDQEMRDVEMSVVPVRSVEKCAKAIVNSACRGDKYLTEPSWTKSTLFFKAFCPELLEMFNGWFLMSEAGSDPPSKQVLDALGLKKILYPESIQSPEIQRE